MTDDAEDVTGIISLDDLVATLARLGRTAFLARLGRLPLMAGGRIERRDCYRRISEVTANVCLLALMSADAATAPWTGCSIPFTGNELMDAVLLREEVKGLVRVLRDRDAWAASDVRGNWLAVAKGAADVSAHADAMALAATGPEGFGPSGGDVG